MCIKTYSRALVSQKNSFCLREDLLCKKKKPAANEKKMLHQAGLGCKKIDLLADDTVEAVLKKVNNVMLKMYAGIQ